MRVEKVELSSGVITGMIQALDSDIEDANSLTNTIESFIAEINSANNLSGESYNKVKNKLSQYKNILEKRKNTSKALKDAISSATNHMKSYMGEYDVLDETKVTELNELRSQAQKTITSLSEKIESETSEEAKQELRKQMYSPAELINKVNKEIDKIEGLGTADSSAYSILESAKSNIFEYNLLVNSLKESQITIL